MTRLRKLALFIKSLFPSQLPMGLTDFNKWADGIILLSGLPNNPSMKVALSGMVMAMGQAEDKKAAHYFVKCLRKGAANEVCYFVTDEARKEWKASQEAAKKAAAEVAATPISA